MTKRVYLVYEADGTLIRTEVEEGTWRGSTPVTDITDELREQSEGTGKDDADGHDDAA